MRTTDDLHPPEPFQGLGEKVQRPATAPQPEWRPVPGSPGIYQNKQGKVRTDQPWPAKFPQSFPLICPEMLP